VLSIADYMRQVDRAAAKLAALQQPVRLVFLCGHDSHKTFKSAAYMAKHYPRDFQYSVLQYTKLPYAGEADNAVRKNNSSAHLVTLEFIADIEIMAAASVYIGSYSNVFTLVQSRRIANSYTDSNSNSTSSGSSSGRVTLPSCFIDSKKLPPVTVCEGTPEMQKYLCYFYKICSPKRH
jgi:hypothetical protein